MARVTYTDLERAAPYVSVNGIEFSHGLPVDVPDDDAETLRLVSRNRWFKVEDRIKDEQETVEIIEAGETDEQQKARIKARGAQAWTEGRDRRVPPRWHEYAQAWLEGYDDAARSSVS